MIQQQQSQADTAVTDTEEATSLLQLIQTLQSHKLLASKLNQSSQSPKITIVCLLQSIQTLQIYKLFPSEMT